MKNGKNALRDWKIGYEGNNTILTGIPGNIHIVILTRSDPALAVSKLRSQHYYLSAYSVERIIRSSRNLPVMENISGRK